MPLFDVSERAAANAKQLKEIQTRAKQSKAVIAADGITRLTETEFMAKAGYPVVVARIPGAETPGLRNAWDVLRSRMSAPGAVVLAGDKDGKPIIMAAGTEEAVAAGFNAGQMIKAIAPAIKGGGGGKPTMAQAGGKDAAGIDEALDMARKTLEA